MRRTPDSLIDDIIEQGIATFERIQKANYEEPYRSQAIGMMIAYMIVQSVEVRQMFPTVSAVKIQHLRIVVLELKKHMAPKTFPPGTPLDEIENKWIDPPMFE